MARLVGQKKAREIWFLSRFYSAPEALQMGLVNAVVSQPQCMHFAWLGLVQMQCVQRKV